MGPGEQNEQLTRHLKHSGHSKSKRKKRRDNTECVLVLGTELLKVMVSLSTSLCNVMELTLNISVLLCSKCPPCIILSYN